MSCRGRRASSIFLLSLTTPGFLFGNSVDNTVIVWDVATGSHIAMLKQHHGFVKGVAWDPFNKYLATQVRRKCALLKASGIF